MFFSPPELQIDRCDFVHNYRPRKDAERPQQGVENLAVSKQCPKSAVLWVGKAIGFVTNSSSKFCFERFGKEIIKETGKKPQVFSE